MIKVLFLSNMAPRYVVDYLDELGKYCDVTALIENRSAKHRNVTWFKYDQKNFKIEFLDALTNGYGDGLSFKPLRYLSKKKYDRIIIGNPTTPTGIVCLLYCRWFHIPFCIQSEGGFRGSGKGLKERFKKYIMEKADYYLTGMDGEKDYFLSYGATTDKLRHYPFTSLHEDDIENHPPELSTKEELRTALGIPEKQVIISVGRLIRIKGVDILLQAYAKTDMTAGLYIIGGKPTEEYSQIIEEHGLRNVHFMDFIQPELVKKYYLAADIFALATRGDTWGLVINEAMANALPVVTTDRCIAGVELIENGVNGYIVPVDNADALSDALTRLLGDAEERKMMAAANIEKIKKYSIENMARTIFSHIAQDSAAPRGLKTAGERQNG